MSSIVKQKNWNLCHKSQKLQSKVLELRHLRNNYEN